MVVFFCACTKGALTVVAATAAAPTPAFLRKSRLFILLGSFHGYRVNNQPNIRYWRHKAIDVYTATYVTLCWFFILQIIYRLSLTRFVPANGKLNASLSVDLQWILPEPSGYPVFFTSLNMALSSILLKFRTTDVS
jgi:hypothetical protein